MLLVDFVDLEPVIIGELSNRFSVPRTKPKVIMMSHAATVLNANEIPEGSVHLFDLMLLQNM